MQSQCCKRSCMRHGIRSGESPLERSSKGTHLQSRRPCILNFKTAAALKERLCICPCIIRLCAECSRPRQAASANKCG